MAAALACGEGAALSHESAAALYEIRWERKGPIEVSVVAPACPRREGIRVHRRQALEVVRHHGIPVTSPACTIVDLTPRLSRSHLEGMISDADARGVIDVERLRAELNQMPPRPGLATLKRVLDIRTFVLTDSELERLFVPIARRAGLPKPVTRQYVNGFKVDFYWPDLRLVVECHSLRYHRTPQQQARDGLRAQTHTARGLRPLSFFHGQIAFEPDHVAGVLRETRARQA